MNWSIAIPSVDVESKEVVTPIKAVIAALRMLAPATRKNLTKVLFIYSPIYYG